MTRSLSCAVHGLFAESLHYHPLGLLVLALFLFTAAHSLLPKWAKLRVEHCMQHHAVLCNGLYLAFAVAFIAVGLVRAVGFLMRGLG